MDSRFEVHLVKPFFSPINQTLASVAVLYLILSTINIAKDLSSSYLDRNIAGLVRPNAVSTYSDSTRRSSYLSPKEWNFINENHRYFSSYHKQKVSLPQELCIASMRLQITSFQAEQETTTFFLEREEAQNARWWEVVELYITSLA